jgi:hypothetical protein
MRSFVWMTEQAWSAVVYYWPLTLALLAAIIVATFLSRRAISHSAARTRLWLAAPLSVPFVILLWGTAMAHSDAATAAPRWPAYALTALLGGSLFFFALCVWRAIGLRWLALAVVLFAAWLTSCTAFIAGMSIANDWI